MKRKGYTLVEIVMAIAIFLVGILPIIALTLNSLKAQKKAAQLEEAARVTGSTIDYIKSRGFDTLNDGVSIGTSNISLKSGATFTASYTLGKEESEGAYVVVKDDGTIPTGNERSFEYDFYGMNINQSTASPDGLFILNSRGIDLEGAKIDVVLKKVEVYFDTTNVGGDYINPLTGKRVGDAEVNKIHFGTSLDGISIVDGINVELIHKDDSSWGVTPYFIMGRVSLDYEDKSNPKGDRKIYGEEFLISPIENWNY